MNPIQALASALTSKEVSFLETMKLECQRRARTSKNAGFTSFWLKKSKGFETRIEQVQKSSKGGK